MKVIFGHLLHYPWNLMDLNFFCYLFMYPISFHKNINTLGIMDSLRYFNNNNCIVKGEVCNRNQECGIYQQHVSQRVS